MNGRGDAPPGVIRGGDSRAVSTAVGYVLNLGVATALVVGLVFAGGTYVEQEREEVIRSELVVVGDRTVAALESADRLVRGGADEVRIELSLPGSVAGASYTARVEETGGGYRLVLASTNPSVTVRFDLVIGTPVSGAASGGTGVVEFVDSDGDGENDSLEVRDG